MREHHRIRSRWSALGERAREARGLAKEELDMKAAVIREYHQPLSIEDIEVPRPAADDVLIQIETCGVCHSDLHIAEGDWKSLLRLIKQPLIPGHEVVGRVIERGENV